MNFFSLKIFEAYVSLCFLLLCSGCWYSPWENLSYRSVDTHLTHKSAQNAAMGINPHLFEAYRVDSAICSVMLKGEGCYHYERGPFTLWLLLSDRIDLDSPCVDRSIFNRSIFVSKVEVLRESVLVWSCEGFPVVLKCSARRYRDQTIFLRSGGRKIILPNILDPKDGKEILIRVRVKSEVGEERYISFRFKPKIDRGSIIVFE